MQTASEHEAQPTKRINRGFSNALKTATDLLQFRGWVSPRHILVVIIGGIVLAEVIAMIFVYYFQNWSYAGQVILDTTIMTVIIFPLLYNLSFKPLLIQIQERTESENIIETRLLLSQYAIDHSLDELLQFILDKMEQLTGSSIGFFHFLENNQQRVWLQTWSTNTLQNMCNAEGKNSHYDVDKAGVWADAVRTRKPTIHNDYATLKNRKGMPDGHARVIREMVIPILRDKQVVAILGVGNKPNDYTTKDLQKISTLADFAWDVVENKRAEIALRQSEEKFRTLVEWTYDWEMWVDPEGNTVYISPSCERITGYKPGEFLEDPDLLLNIIHPDDRPAIAEHQTHSHDVSYGQFMIEYRIAHRDGSERWIEHICRPLFGPQNEHLGRRISNRDITERKLAEQKIFEQNKKEKALQLMIQTIQKDIARDLHDTLGQNISYMRMNLSNLSEIQWNDPVKVKSQLQKMTNVANESYDLIRAMLGVLRSTDSYDPLELFNRYAHQVAERSNFQIILSNEGSPKNLSVNQIRQLFYIFREALSNIEKYAHAEHVTGEFTWREHELMVCLSDDGIGFDPHSVPAENHYGLKFMNERAELIKGSFTLKSAPRLGTTITVSIPYE
jgi:PAS domain S-box-containing protein